MLLNDKPLVIQVDGGIGRVICSLPAIEALAQTRKVIVLTSFPEIFIGNPRVHKTYSLTREYLWDDVIKHGEFLYPEPYFSHRYYNQEQHLVQVFNHLLLGEAGSVDLGGKLYLTEDEITWAKDFILARKQEFEDKDIVLLQCFGSSAKIENNTVTDTTNRSLPTSAVDAVCANTKHLYINASHIAMNYPNVWQQAFTTRQLFALAAYCDFIISIDSFLMHVGAVFKKAGLVFFGSTFTKNLSYDTYRVFQRKGYPKSYVPNRFSGFVDENARALDFDEAEVEHIIDVINSKEF